MQIPINNLDKPHCHIYNICHKFDIPDDLVKNDSVVSKNAQNQRNIENFVFFKYRKTLGYS